MAATAATHGGALPRHDGFHLDPPLYYPPTLQHHGGALENSMPSFPFYGSSSIENISHPPGLDAVHFVEAGKPVPRSETDGSEDTSMGPPLSHQVHVLGFTTEAKFVTHALASIPRIPPVQLFVHHPTILSRWGQEGRNIRLLDADGHYISSREILCPEFIGPFTPGLMLRHYGTKMKYLDNVIVSTASWSVVSSLKHLQNRIDRRTTICLLHKGLGLMEWLNQQVFTDPTLRPRYVLGHFSHKISKHSDTSYTVKTKNEGKLYLYCVPEYVHTSYGQTRRSPEAMRQTQNLVKLLSATEYLGTVGVEWDSFLFRKLPGVVFSSLADSISVILGCRYDQILNDHHAVRLWNTLLDETIHIILSFPEIQNKRIILKYFEGASFRKHLWSRLVARKDTYSPWITWIRNGHNSGVHFANGYFIKRATAMGVSHAHNSMVMDLVSARQKARRRELERDIPYGLAPYIMDGDKLGGGQGVDDPELDNLEDSI
ncbi:hypothetical protein F5X96DRAFT_616875 [Biscogniauxia mediterranea]|nr:hypothetical protein F5X96DRAFT_616875 [Biscogniauxia mediterranea]